MPRVKKTADRREKPSKLSRLSSSAKADKLADMIKQSLSKTQRVARAETSRTGKGLKQRAMKAHFNPNDFIDTSLPKKDRKIVKELIADAEDDDGEVIESLFEKAFTKLHDQAAEPNADFRSDEASRSFQRAAYALILNMIPIAELTYRQTRKQQDAYVVTTYIDEARELANDLRMMNDADNQIEFIGKRILHPMMLGAGQTLLTEMSGLKAVIDTEVHDKSQGKAVKRAVDAVTQSIGTYLSELQLGLMAQVGSYLQGDTSAFDIPAALNKTKKRKRKRQN